MPSRSLAAFFGRLSSLVPNFWTACSCSAGSKCFVSDFREDFTSNKAPLILKSLRERCCYRNIIHPNNWFRGKNVAFTEVWNQHKNASKKEKGNGSQNWCRETPLIHPFLASLVTNAGELDPSDLHKMFSASDMDLASKTSTWHRKGMWRIHVERNTLWQWIPSCWQVTNRNETLWIKSMHPPRVYEARASRRISLMICGL